MRLELVSEKENDTPLSDLVKFFNEQDGAFSYNSAVENYKKKNPHNIPKDEDLTDLEFSFFEQGVSPNDSFLKYMIFKKFVLLLKKSQYEGEPALDWGNYQKPKRPDNPSLLALEDRGYNNLDILENPKSSSMLFD
jgi:hypothetical protein